MENMDNFLKSAGIHASPQEIEDACKKQEDAQQKQKNEFIDNSITGTEVSHQRILNKINKDLNTENNSINVSESRINHALEKIDPKLSDYKNDSQGKIIDGAEKNIRSSLRRIDTLRGNYTQENQRKERSDGNIEFIKNNPINLN